MQPSDETDIGFASAGSAPGLFIRLFEVKNNPHKCTHGAELCFIGALPDVTFRRLLKIMEIFYYNGENEEFRKLVVRDLILMFKEMGLDPNYTEEDAIMEYGDVPSNIATQATTVDDVAIIDETLDELEI